MDLKEDFEGENIQTTEWKDKDQSDDITNSSQIKWNRLIGSIVAVSIGFFCGLSCKQLHESFLYTGMFLGESIICFFISGIIKTLSFKNTIVSFSIFFIVAGISTPLAAWIGSMLI